MKQKYDDFDELFNDAANEIGRGQYGYFKRLTGSGYGDNKVIAYATLGTDGGDVNIYACKETPENRAALLAYWNEHYGEYPMDDSIFIQEWWTPQFGKLGLEFNTSFYG